MLDLHSLGGQKHDADGALCLLTLVIHNLLHRTLGYPLSLLLL